ncbi:MAG: hypothetical protein EHM61_22990 [Acidobacteria bacterium]|nr:MAG: hypothetical protein EHM61_22990 [Acidobacteriota bacterium]
MTKTTRVLLTLSLTLVLVSFTPFALGDDPKTQSQTDTQQEPSVMGDLKSVDADTKTLVVTTSDGTDMQFAYNETTEIVGAQGTIEGLSANAGSKVKVFYKEEDGKKTATRIKVKDAKTDS